MISHNLKVCHFSNLSFSLYDPERGPGLKVRHILGFF